MQDLIIDGHRHVLCLKAYTNAMKNKLIDQSYYHPTSLSVNLKKAKDWFRKMTNVQEHVSDLNSASIDMAILQPTPMEFYYGAELKKSAELSRLINENTAQFVDECPERFMGLATLPLQDVKLALEELSHAVEQLGLRGVAMGSSVNGIGFDEEIFLPFFKEIERLDIPIFIHPTNPLESERLSKYYLSNFLGFPMDTTLAASQLVFGGVLDRFPKLKIFLAHAGGVLPFLLGRLEHGQSIRPESQEKVKHPFSYYLKNFYVDTITFHPEILKFVLSIMPEAHVFMGTDYPFDMSDTDPINSVTTGVSNKDKANEILGSNLARLMGIQK
ncbi:MAG: amidohydrolase family protein [Promethearchaeota archaeon]